MRRSLFVIATGLLLQLASQAATAHPLPDTTITLNKIATGVEVTVVVPLNDLLLALPKGLHRDELLTHNRQEVVAYFRQHMSVRNSKRQLQLPEFSQLQQVTLSNDHIGSYEGLRLVAAFKGNAPLEMQYDAIIHQVPNHKALVFWVTDKDDDRRVGQLSYDFLEKRTRPVKVNSLR